MENEDADMAREIIALKAIDLGMTPEKVESLDAVVCAMLRISNPDPLTFLDGLATEVSP